ncbi:THAP domain-containing protein 6-like [Diretmus argenteus]
MPHTCAAFGCRNRRNIETKHRGVTFHKFPKDPGLRKAWAMAVRRKNFEPNDTTVLCSCHFKAEDLDKTGQTVRVREHVIPSVFASFQDHLNKVPNKSRSTRTPTQAGEASDGPVPVSKSPEPLNSSTSDHALDPDQVKYKLAEAQARVQELQGQLRNAEDRERRQKRTLKSLLDDLKEKNMISEELQRKLDHYSGRFSSFI